MYFVVCFKIVINVELPKYIIYLFIDVVLKLYWIFDVCRLVCVCVCVCVCVYIYIYIHTVDIVDPKLSLSLAHFGACSHPSHFTTMEGFPITHRTGGWMGPGLVQTFGRRNNLCPYLQMHQNFLVIQLTA